MSQQFAADTSLAMQAAMADRRRRPHSIEQEWLDTASEPQPTTGYRGGGDEGAWGHPFVVQSRSPSHQGQPPLRRSPSVVVKPSASLPNASGSRYRNLYFGGIHSTSRSESHLAGRSESHRAQVDPLAQNASVLGESQISDHLRSVDALHQVNQSQSSARQHALRKIRMVRSHRSFIDTNVLTATPEISDDGIPTPLDRQEPTPNSQSLLRSTGPVPNVVGHAQRLLSTSTRDTASRLLASVAASSTAGRAALSLPPNTPLPELPHRHRPAPYQSSSYTQPQLSTLHCTDDTVLETASSVGYAFESEEEEERRRGPSLSEERDTLTCTPEEPKEHRSFGVQATDLLPEIHVAEPDSRAAGVTLREVASQSAAVEAPEEAPYPVWLPQSTGRAASKSSYQTLAEYALRLQAPPPQPIRRGSALNSVSSSVQAAAPPGSLRGTPLSTRRESGVVLFQQLIRSPSSVSHISQAPTDSASNQFHGTSRRPSSVQIPLDSIPAARNNASTSINDRAALPSAPSAVPSTSPSLAASRVASVRPTGQQGSSLASRADSYSHTNLSHKGSVVIGRPSSVADPDQPYTSTVSLNKSVVGYASPNQATPYGSVAVEPAEPFSVSQPQPVIAHHISRPQSVASAYSESNNSAKISRVASNAGIGRTASYHYEEPMPQALNTSAEPVMVTVSSALVSRRGSRVESVVSETESLRDVIAKGRAAEVPGQPAGPRPQKYLHHASVPSAAADARLLETDVVLSHNLRENGSAAYDKTEDAAISALGDEPMIVVDDALWDEELDKMTERLQREQITKLQRMHLQAARAGHKKGFRSPLKGTAALLSANEPVSQQFLSAPSPSASRRRTSPISMSEPTPPPALYHDASSGFQHATSFTTTPLPAMPAPTSSEGSSDETMNLIRERYLAMQRQRQASEDGSSIGTARRSRLGGSDTSNLLLANFSAGEYSRSDYSAQPNIREASRRDASEEAFEVHNIAPHDGEAYASPADPLESTMAGPYVPATATLARTLTALPLPSGPRYIFVPPAPLPSGNGSKDSVPSHPTALAAIVSDLKFGGQLCHVCDAPARGKFCNNCGHLIVIVDDLL